LRRPGAILAMGQSRDFMEKRHRNATNEPCFSGLAAARSWAAAPPMVQGSDAELQIGRAAVVARLGLPAILPLNVVQRTDGVCRLDYLFHTVQTHVTVDDRRGHHAISMAILGACLRFAGLCDHNLQFNL
jgi:hypothetical protein